MENKLEIKFGDKKIVAEVNDWSDGGPNELTVYLCDKDNCIIQDICLVRPHYEITHYDVNGKIYEFETNNEFIDCLVWSNSDEEDYTHKFVIGVYEEDEEC